jgi:hypothetical protein
LNFVQLNKVSEGKACMNRDEIHAARQEDFEQQVVCKILRHGGLIGQIRELKKDHQSHFGSRKLTLAWLRKRYPDFPLRLGAPPPPKDTSLSWGDLYYRLTATPLFRMYKQWQLAQSLDDRREPLGIVFNSYEMTVAVHNLPGDQTERHGRIVRLLGNPPVTIVIESFDVMLQRIGKDWAGR